LDGLDVGVRMAAAEAGCSKLVAEALEEDERMYMWMIGDAG